jgi:hypothetical protein
MILRRGLVALGAVLIVFGIFFALQGADIIHWPLESSMLGKSMWIRNGLAIAVIGAVIILSARRFR